jgi:hypothetical protein
MQKQFVKQKTSVPDVPGDDVIGSCFIGPARSGVERLLLHEAQHERYGEYFEKVQLTLPDTQPV